MLSLPLLAKEIKSNCKVFLIFLAVLAMYISIIVSMFDPKIGETLKQFEEAMPEMMAAFGMVSSGSNLIDFLGSYLFGMLLLIFPLIYEIIVANRLIARYVDRGSMAYLLASPNKRKKLAITQAIFLLGSTGLLIFLSMVIGIAVSESLFPGALDIKGYIALHGGLFGLHLALSGFGFFASCIFDETKYSYAVSTGVPIFFYLVQMLVNMGDKLENLKYITLFTLFNPLDIIAGKASAVWMTVALGIIGITLYGAGIYRFSRRDLPL